MSKSIKLYAESSERGFFWPLVYFHGLLELQLGHDLVRAGVDLADVQDGLHDCTVFVDGAPVQVKLALWSYDRGENYGIARKGIVVRADEPKDVEFMTKHFEDKSRSL